MRKFSIIFLLLFIFVPSTFAFEDNIGFSKITPASNLYFLKAIREKIELHFAQTDKVKMYRQLEFAFRRLREARTLIGNKEDLIQSTLERYIFQLDILSDKHRKDDETEVRMSNNLAVHLKVLEQMYQDAKRLKAKMAIRMVLNKLIQRRDTPNLAKIPICNLFIREASSSALNQTDQFLLKERAQNCFKSLTFDK